MHRPTSGLARAALTLLLLGALVPPGLAGITVTGSAAPETLTRQRNRLASWLTHSLGTKVTINASGVMSIEAGGNASATRLRNMINNPPQVTLDIVSDDTNVSFGGWNSEDPNNIYGKTTGTQTIDIKDIENIGNIYNRHGFTPDLKLMHEITEVWEGRKHHGDCWAYHMAHTEAIKAEQELMSAHGTSWVGSRYTSDGAGRLLMKIRRQDGTFVVVRFRPYSADQDVEWFTEKVACNTAQGLIAIADPDPQVHLFDYDLAHRNHTLAATIDTLDSRPTGVAFDAAGLLYVSEDLAGQDEIRVFHTSGLLVDTIVSPLLVDPRGLDVDRATGDIFVAVSNAVLRLDGAGNLLGTYQTGSPWEPTDVAAWRNDGLAEDIYGAANLFELFVTDRASSQVFRFDAEADLNRIGYRSAFGAGLLAAPEGVSVDSWDQVWVASTGNHRVLRFTPDGNVITRNGVTHFLEEPTRRLMDVAMVDSDGLYVVDGSPGNGRLLLYDLDGVPTHDYGASVLQCPESIAVDLRVDDLNLLPAADPSDLGSAPVLHGVPPDATAPCDAVPPPPVVTASDACHEDPPVVEYSEVRIDGTCPDRYLLERTWTATNVCGNTTSATRLLHVEDTAAPAVTGVLEPLVPVPPRPPGSPASVCSPPHARTFRVRCAASDSCDPGPLLEARLLVTNSYQPPRQPPREQVDEVAVSCGEVLAIHLLRGPCAARAPRSPRAPESVDSTGLRTVTGEDVRLRVAAEDRCGNSASASYDPTVEPSPLCDEVLDDGSCCPALARPQDDRCCDCAALRLRLLGGAQSEPPVLVEVNTLPAGCTGAACTTTLDFFTTWVDRIECADEEGGKCTGSVEDVTVITLPMAFTDANGAAVPVTAIQTGLARDTFATDKPRTPRFEFLAEKAGGGKETVKRSRSRAGRCEEDGAVDGVFQLLIRFTFAGYDYSGGALTAPNRILQQLAMRCPPQPVRFRTLRLALTASDVDFKASDFDGDGTLGEADDYPDPPF